MNINILRKIFTEVNEINKSTGESVVDFSDVEYYADQIHNCFEVSKEEAIELAKQLAQ
jgi:hypothetical protein